MPTLPPARRLLVFAASLGLVACLGLVAATTQVAVADHTPPPSVVTLAGSLQSELGCAADWDPACAATELTLTDAGSYARAVELPAGSYEFKVALNGGWDENYGAGGVANGPDLPLVLEADAEVTFSYDHTSHRIAVAPTHPQPGLTDADRELAGDSLRAALTDERFYFVMADRFDNGDPSNDTGGHDAAGDRRAAVGARLRPRGQGLLPRRRHRRDPRRSSTTSRTSAPPRSG